MSVIGHGPLMKTPIVLVIDVDGFTVQGKRGEKFLLEAKGGDYFALNLRRRYVIRILDDKLKKLSRDKYKFVSLLLLKCCSW